MSNENKTLSEFLGELLQDTTQKKEIEKLAELEGVYQFFTKKGYKKDFNEFKGELGEIMKKYLELQNISENDLETVAGGTGKRMTSMALTALMLTNLGAGATNVGVNKSAAQPQNVISSIISKGKNFIEADKNKPFVMTIGASLAAVAGTAVLAATTAGLYATYKNFIDLFEFTAGTDDKNSDLKNATGLLSILESSANIKFVDGKTDLDSNYAGQFKRVLETAPFWQTSADVGITGQTTLEGYYNDLNTDANTSYMTFSDNILKLTLASICYSGILDMKVTPKFSKNAKDIISLDNAKNIKAGISAALKQSGDELKNSYNEICTKVRTLLKKSIDDLRSEQNVISQSKKSLESVEKSLEKLAKVKDKSNNNESYKNKLEEILKQLKKKKVMLETLKESKESDSSTTAIDTAIGNIDTAITNVNEAITKAGNIATQTDDATKKTLIADAEKAINEAKTAVAAAAEKLGNVATNMPKTEIAKNGKKDDEIAKCQTQLDTLKTNIQNAINHIIAINGSLVYLEGKLGKTNKELSNVWNAALTDLQKIKGFNSSTADNPLTADEAQDASKIIYQLLENSGVIGLFNTYGTDAKFDDQDKDFDGFKSAFKSWANTTAIKTADSAGLGKVNNLVSGGLETILKAIEDGLEKDKKAIEKVLPNDKDKLTGGTIQKYTLENLKTELDKLKTTIESKGSLTDEKLSDKLTGAIDKLNTVISGLEKDKTTATFAEVEEAVKLIRDNRSDILGMLTDSNGVNVKDLLEIVAGDNSYGPLKGNGFLTNKALEAAKDIATKANTSYDNAYKGAIKAKFVAIKGQIESYKTALEAEKQKITNTNSGADTSALDARIGALGTQIGNLNTLVGPANTKPLTDDNIKTAFNAISAAFAAVKNDIAGCNGDKDGIAGHGVDFDKVLSPLLVNLGGTTPSTNDLKQTKTVIDSVTKVLDTLLKVVEKKNNPTAPNTQ